MDRTLLTILSVNAVLLASPIEGATLCNSRKIVLEAMASQFKEVPSAVGLTADGNAVELLVSPDKSFTVIVTTPQGLSCILTTGEAWIEDKQERLEPQS